MRDPHIVDVSEAAPGLCLPLRDTPGANPPPLQHTPAASPTMSDDKPQAKSQPQSRTSTTSTTLPSGSGWFSIPAPLARLFKRFPLLTYPPNELPLRSPQQQRDVATLYVFISDADALKGLPSYNPTCLKWQTFLRLAGIKNLKLASSSNHASPNGALPFLIPGPSSGSSSNTTSPAAIASSIVSSNKLEQFALSHAQSHSRPSISDIPASQNHRLESYTAFLDRAIRNAWLFTLYLDPANTDLLRHWYILPTSNSSVVQTATLYQLRAAAEAEIIKSAGGGVQSTLQAVYNQASRSTGQRDTDKKGSNKIYIEARGAFAALAACLEETATESGWFFGTEAPGVFDAAVFAYTYLILLDPAASPADVDGASEVGWGGSTLANIVREFPALVRHRDRVYERCWGGSTA